MQGIKKVAVLLVCLVGLVLGIWFCVDNSHPTALFFAGFEAPAIPTGLLVLLSVLLGYVVSFPQTWFLKSRNQSLTRKLQRRDKELERERGQVSGTRQSSAPSKVG